MENAINGLEILSSLINEINDLKSFCILGKVTSVEGLRVTANFNTKFAAIGSRCHIKNNYDSIIEGEIVGFENKDLAIISTFMQITGVYPDCEVFLDPQMPKIYPSRAWLGRIINGLAEPLDKKGFLPKGNLGIFTKNTPPIANLREKVEHKIDVGVKSINTFLTCCLGQRMGIFAGSGVGKSILMSMLAKFTQCDVCVIGLIGERGREVRDFIEDTLGEDGLKKSILVISTSDETALMRRQAAYLTMTICEYFRDQGLSVLCLLDSVTRFAMAQREIGLANKEPPTTKGYTPSVFSELPKLLERAGSGIKDKDGKNGNITGFFTVLVDGDDHNEPIADSVRGILDGHIVLDRELAIRGHFPAINILKSVSRKVPDCHDSRQRQIIQKARQLISSYSEMEELIKINAYKTGINQKVDKAIKVHDDLENFLMQNNKDFFSLDDSFERLEKIVNSVD